LKVISEKQIIDTVSELLSSVNFSLTPDVSESLKCSALRERNPLAKDILKKLEDNLVCAKKNNVPVCQDTGMAVVFYEIGMNVHIDTNRSLQSLTDEAVKKAYTGSYLRLSVVSDPLRRVNTQDNTPAVVYTQLVEGDTFKVTVAPKGFGSENMSRIRMFNPTASPDDIISFITETVKEAGSNPCPPVVVGVGIGGTFDYCAYLAKKSLCRPIGEKNSDEFYAKMEEEALRRINSLDIGPQGFGGDTTALSVAITAYPTHIAGLPVAVNINCHAARHKSAVL